LSDAIAKIDMNIALYPKIGLRELVAKYRDVIPNAGNKKIYTLEGPKTKISVRTN
jgi:hypothetical protein